MTRAERKRNIRKKAKELFKELYTAETGLSRQQRKLVCLEMAKEEIE